MQSQESGAVEVGVEVEGAQPSCLQNHNQVILASGFSREEESFQKFALVKSGQCFLELNFSKQVQLCMCVYVAVKYNKACKKANR